MVTDKRTDIDKNIIIRIIMQVMKIRIKGIVNFNSFLCLLIPYLYTYAF